MREHRAFAASRRAARIENRGEIVCAALRDFVAVALRRHGIRQRAIARVIQCVNARHFSGVRNRLNPRERFGRTHHDRWLCVADEVLDFAGLIRGVQRQKRIPRAQYA